MQIKQDQVKVTFNKLVVHDNGDNNKYGELSWVFTVDGAAVERSSSNADKVVDGQTIRLGEQRIVTKARKRGVFLTVGGLLLEKDDLLSGKSEMDDFSKTYAAVERWGAGDHEVNFHDTKLDATLHFNIELV